MYRGKKTIITQDFPSKIVQVRRQRSDIFKELKKRMSPQSSINNKISFKNEGEIKTCSSNKTNQAHCQQTCHKRKQREVFQTELGCRSSNLCCETEVWNITKELPTCLTQGPNNPACTGADSFLNHTWSLSHAHPYFVVAAFVTGNCCFVLYFFRPL
jgi:hypothetical protein